MTFFERIIPSLVVLLIVTSVGSIPILLWYSSGVEQRAINEQCNTNYSRVDVMLSGDTLKELCKIKEQQLTLK